MEKYIDLLHGIYDDSIENVHGKNGIIVFNKDTTYEIIECDRIPQVFINRTIYDCVIPWHVNKPDDATFLPTAIEMIQGSYNTTAFEGLVPFKSILSQNGVFCIKSLNKNGPLKDFEFYSKNSGRSRSSSREILGRGCLPYEVTITNAHSYVTNDLYMKQTYGILKDYWCSNLLSNYYNMHTYMIDYTGDDFHSDSIVEIKKMAYSYGVGMKYISWAE